MFLENATFGDTDLLLARSKWPMHFILAPRGPFSIMVTKKA